MGCMGSRIFPDLYAEKSKPEERPKAQKNPNVLRGDVTLKNESRMLREKTFKERMLKRTSAAEEMSGKIMEERERLSLGTRSMATSRATSRTGSPVGTSRRQVHFKPEDKTESVNSSTSKQGKGGKIKRSLPTNNEGKDAVVMHVNGNAIDQSGPSSKKRQTADQSEQVSQNNLHVQPVKNENLKNKDQSQSCPPEKVSGNEKQQHLEIPAQIKHSETTDLNQNMSQTLSTIEERASSRTSDKLETEAKRG